MERYKRRAEARLNYESKVTELKTLFLPLVKDAIALGDYDRLILLEAQREFRLSRLLLDWQIIDDAFKQE